MVTNWFMVWQGDFEKGISHFAKKYGIPTLCLVKELCKLSIPVSIDQNINKEEIWITGEFNDEKLRTGSKNL